MKYPLFICLIFLILSCSSEEPDSFNEADLYGDWNLISAETNREMDYNGDGTPSLDIIEDSDCFTIELYLHEDNTFEEIFIDKHLEDISDCTISNQQGEWSLNEDNELELIYLDDSNTINKTIENPINIINSSLFEIERNFTDDDGVFLSSLRFSLIRN